MWCMNSSNIGSDKLRKTVCEVLLLHKPDYALRLLHKQDKHGRQ